MTGHDITLGEALATEIAAIVAVDRAVARAAAESVGRFLRCGGAPDWLVVPKSVRRAA